MPQVFHVVRKFEPAEWGGIETHLVGLIPELSRLGWSSVVLAPRERGTDGEAVERVGATFRTFRAFYPYLGMTASRRARLVAAGGNLLSPEALSFLVRVPLGGIVHAHTQGRLGGIVRTAARLRRLPYAVSLHGPVRADAAVVERDARNRTEGMIDLGAPAGMLLGARRVVQDADLVFSLNRAEHDAWLDDRRGRHLALVSHGVDLAKASEAVRREARARIPEVGASRFVVVVARMDRAKGQDVALEAFLQSAPPDVHMVFAGAPVDPAFAREIREKAGASRRVHVLGGVPPHVARGLLAEAALAVVPSRAEPFGIVLLEAWAEETPALAADVGGLRDIAHTTGAREVLVSGGVEAWSQRLHTVLADSPFLDTERGQVRDRVARNYSWRALAEQTVNAYERAVQKVPS